MKKIKNNKKMIFKLYLSLIKIYNITQELE